jgi:hypothetical protein
MDSDKNLSLQTIICIFEETSIKYSSKSLMCAITNTASNIQNQTSQFLQKT